MNEAVVIFDRVRENTRTHRRTDSYEKLAHDSIAQSIHRSIYTLTTVLFACGALHFFGGDSTKNFSLVMLIGFISGLIRPSASTRPCGSYGRTIPLINAVPTP